MLVPLDLSSLLQFVCTALLLVVGSLFLVRKAASRYFVVDSTFELDNNNSNPMSIGGSSSSSRGGGGGAGDDGTCAECGRKTAKRCSRCKSVWYCSQACQSKHWEKDHKLKCKQGGLSGKVDIALSGNGACRGKKSSGFGSISLVPARGTCKVLQEPKRILFPYDEFVKLFNWDMPGLRPCGLLNCGNSCFANVVLQCLAYTRPLVAYMLEKDHSKGCVRKWEDWCFLCELQIHIRRASESQQPFSPINILSRLPNMGGNLGYGSQEDAHEFMRFAIDTMQSACLDQHGGEKVLDLSTQETTLIQYIFGGHLQSQVICTECNMISNRYENMMDLTVEIHGDAGSLEECLDQFTAKEWLDGENMYKCDGCNDYVKAWKQLTVHRAPNILTIALKRFQSGRFGKLNKRVTFPENLNLAPYMSGNGDGSDWYSLYAVVVHVDMLNASYFGHYICYTKDSHGRWYRIDDCKVTIVEVEEVLSQGAYMLLYSRKEARREPFIKPMEPAREKHLAKSDVNQLNVPNTANLSAVLSGIPSNPESNLSLLRDTGHDRQTEIEIDSSKGIEKEHVVSEVPVEINPAVVPKDVDTPDSNLSSFPMKEGSSSQYSHVPEICEEGNSIQFGVCEDVLLANPLESVVSVATQSPGINSGRCEEAYDSSVAEIYMGEGNGRQSDIKTDPFKGKEEEDVVSEVPNEIDPTFVPMDIDTPDCNLISLKEVLQEGSSSQYPPPHFGLREDVLLADPLESIVVSIATPSSEINTDRCEEAYGSSGADIQMEEDHGRQTEINPLEVPVEINPTLINMGIDIPDSNLSSLETKAVAQERNSSKYCHVPEVLEEGNSSQIGVREDVILANPLESSKPTSDPSVIASYSSSSGNGVHKLAEISRGGGGITLFSVNGSNGRSSGQPKPLFSRGFLNRPAGKKSVNHEKRIQMENPNVASVPMVNGYSNGHSECNSAVSYASLEPICQKEGHAHSVSDTTFLSRDFSKKSSKKSADVFKIEQTNGSGSVELTCGPESSSYLSGMETNGTVPARENGHLIYGKDAISEMENDGNNGSVCQSAEALNSCL